MSYPVVYKWHAPAQASAGIAAAAAISRANGASRGQIMELQRAMLDILGIDGDHMPQEDADKVCPLVHHFAPGLYAREILLPAGSVVVGKIHRHAHINTISRGRVTVATEFGTEELVGPCTFVSTPGTKRVVVAHEDTIWTTYHPTEENDLGLIEQQVIAPTFEAYEQERLKWHG